MLALAQDAAWQPRTEGGRHDGRLKPPTRPELLAKFGPLRAYQTGQRLDTAVDPDRLVKTHCCFCGQQCGIQLKVKDNEVIGFEPWEDFPFNKGHALPQGRPPLPAGLAPRPADLAPTSATRRCPRGSGPSPTTRRSGAWPSEIGRIQSTYGNDAFAVLGGASMTTEKCYLLGQVRPGLPEDPAHRLQRPAVHGQRRGRQQEGVRHRPGRQPDERHPAGRGHLDRRGQRRRVRPDHHQLRLAGPRERGAGSSTSIRASRRWPAPAT